MKREDAVLIYITSKKRLYCRLCMVYDTVGCIRHETPYNAYTRTCLCVRFRELVDEDITKYPHFDNTIHKIIQLKNGKCNLNQIYCRRTSCNSNIEDCPNLDKETMILIFHELD